MKIIGLDSSGLVASVAVAEENQLIAEYSVQYQKTHSQTLLPMLHAVSEMTELNMDEVDAIAIAAGPGSFTGLRIGAATAKGLGFAIQKPIVGIPTVEAMAYNLYGTRQLICPIMDARRGQVYTGIYEFVLQQESERPINYELREVCGAKAVMIEDLAIDLNKLQREVIFMGDGVPVFESRLKDLMEVQYSFAPAHLSRQRAGSVAMAGFHYMKEGKEVPADVFSPEYLRLSQAERELNEQKAGAK